jgi:xanthine/CO dehydrogenase XdhC/CoxF family maturation factor
MVDPSFRGSDPLQSLAEMALASGGSTETKLSLNGTEVRIWTDFRPARPGLWIFGAGDDAQPLLELGKALGWYVTVADGRSHLATPQRFASADETHVLPVGGTHAIKAAERPPVLANLRSQDAAVVMSHSFEQDSRALASLLALDEGPAYIGVLGPQRRTRELLVEAARLLNLSLDPSFSNSAWAERWLGELHAPTGLDLGAESPETIALSVVTEIQKSLTGATALPLSEVRAAAQAISVKPVSSPTEAAPLERQRANSLAGSSKNGIGYRR